MAYVFNVNYPASTTGPESMYQLKVVLKSAGWTVPSSGDATSYFSSSDGITSGSSGAGGWANNSAWVRIQDPGGVREFTIQRGTTNPVWTIKYSASAKFTGGTPNATTPPTATDSQTIVNNATLFTTDSTYRVHTMADNASPYGFYMFCSDPRGSPPFQNAAAPSGVFIMDPMKSGSYDAADQDPVIIIAQASSGLLSTTSTAPVGYLKKGLAGEGFVNVPWLKSSGNRFPSYAQSTPRNGKNRGFPVMYARRAAATDPDGWKGLSSLLMYNCMASAMYQLFTQTTARDRIAVGDMTLPWSGAEFAG